MKKRNKFLSVFLALIMIISIIPMSTITASADAGVSVPDYDGKELVFGDYEYAVVSEIEKTCLIEEYRGTDTEVVIPSEINGYSVIELYAKSFYGIESTSITIPNTVFTIGNEAFYSCDSLTSVTIPDSVATIGEYAFASCDMLECIAVNSNNKYYSSDEYGALFNKDKTILIQYPMGNTRTSYTIPSSVSTIGSSAFCGCNSLTGITLSNNLVSIDDYAFSRCENLTTVTIPDSVMTIGSHTFAYNDNLESVIIGDGVTSIGEFAFVLCYRLTNIAVDSDNQHYSNDEYGVLFNKNKTTIIQYPAGNTRTNYIIPDSVTTISDWAFSSCKSLMSVTLGDSVTTIGESAFISCWGLTNIVFPDSLSIIEDSAFEFCHYLNDVHYSGTEDNWNSITIGNENYDLTGATIHFNCEGQYTETIINPTCVNDGKKIYNCDCGIYREEEIPALGHNFENDYCTVCNVSINHYYCEYEVTDHKDATCYEDGYTTYTCKECGYYYTDVIYAYHDFGEGVVVEEATCTKDGYGTQTCTICGFTETYNIYVGHEYGDWTVTIEPTCTTEGEETHTCINCGNSESKTIGIRHNYGDTVIVTEPTCTTEGETKTTCTECGYSYTGSIPIKHNYIKISEGQFECTECGNINTKYIELVPNTSHAHIGDIVTVDVNIKNCSELSALTFDVIYDNTAFEIVDYDVYNIFGFHGMEVVNPNLTSKFRYAGVADSTLGSNNETIVTISFKVLKSGGEIYYTIREASDYNSNYIDIVNLETIKIGHAYENISTKQPTCTEQGYTTYTCECGDSYIDNYTDALGHKSVAVEVIPATCQQEGKQYDMCETCGVSLSDIVTVPKTDHTPGNWEIITEATSTADGKKVKKCNVCGTVIEEETIPATGNDDLGYATDNDTGVSVEFPKSEYNGKVGINVEEVIDDSETIFQLVNSDGNIINSKPYNITMTVNGVETQPNGDVTVKVPLPEGFNPELSLVKHIDLTTGAVEDITSEYIDGYLVFKTNHFSIYVIVEECNYTFSIQNPSRNEIRNKDGIILHANVEGNAPNGSYVKWESSNGNFDEDANGYDLEIIAKNKGWTTFTAILCDADGNELARDSVDMYSKSGFFDKIGGFFRSLFGTTKIYEN